MEYDLNRFREAFFQDCEENLARMESCLLRLERNECDRELLDDIFRSAHSIKGASATFGFEELTSFTHGLETLLDAVRGGEVESLPVASLLLEAKDTVAALIEAARVGGASPEGASQLTNRLLAAASKQGTSPPVSVSPACPVSSEPPAPANLPSVVSIRFRPSPDIFQRALDPVLVIRELAACGELLSVHLDSEIIPPLAGLDPELCYLSWDISLRTSKARDELEAVFIFVEDGAEIVIKYPDLPQSSGLTGTSSATPAAADRAARSHREPSSIRVSTEKIDKLVDLVGELVIAQSMAAQVLQDFSPAKLDCLREAFAELESNTRELQERVMGIRMIPVGSVFSRFPRLVRDLCAETGKKIQLEISGEETELDKSVIESLADPLTHIIRNSADHGVELPEERLRLGKAEEGTIRLHTYHYSGNVIVEVSDDGRGLNSARIREKAIERGLLSPDASPSEQDLYQLIFAAGLSTAEKVTDISGRGVGMDVVRRNLEALNGDVSVGSVPGSGTCIKLKLPLTLAIVDGLLVKVGTECYVLPLTSILESIRPAKSQLNGLAGTGETIVVRGEPLALIRLHEVFHVPGAITDPTKAIVVLVESQGQRVALLVDELLRQQQVVVKSLEANYRKVNGIIGATVLGDGRAALIIDVAGLTRIEHAFSAA